jgi:dCMP deaminase
MSRPSWDKYFMDIAFLVSTRATCLRRKVGAILVKQRRILATGYNGPPRGIKHCGERENGCLREQLGIPSGERHEISRATHAEQNVIIQAAVHGISIEGSTLYSTNFPCVICTKMLLNAGVVEIVYADGYADELSAELLKEAKLKVRKYIPERQN